MKSGRWESPLTARQVASSSISFEDLAADLSGVYWTESRPLEKGRAALVKSGKELSSLKHFSVKSRLHEYGGGSISCQDGVVYFVNDTEKSLCRYCEKDDSIETLFSKEHLRYAEMAIHPSGKFLYFVGEDHQDSLHVTNALYLLDLSTKTCQVVASGHDFYVSPKISPSGEALAFICWNFPHMSWDESSLWTAEIAPDGNLLDLKNRAGSVGESILNPVWGSSGTLYYVGDKTGFWNIYSLKGENRAIVYEKKADFASPQWKLGGSSFAEVSYKGASAIVACYSEMAIDKLGLILLKNQTMETIDLPFTSMTHIKAVDAEHVYFFGASPTHARSVICLNLLTKQYKVLQSSFIFPFTEEYISIPELLSFPSSIEGKQSFGFYYPPKNLSYPPLKEKPPLIVRAHGGPTGHNAPVLSQEIQFWTTRGFAYLDVNYGGSSGHGREYRDRLKKNWGIIDVRDCILAAQYATAQNLAHPQKLVIKGSSSGGLTALMAICGERVFAAATSYYGVADLEMIAVDTHKFELHYPDSLVGPYPECKSLYQERSPVNKVDKIVVPVLLLQGLDDKVVPLEQSEKIYLKLKEKGLDAELLLFEGEGHGFRKAETIEKALIAEWNFYKRVLSL
jgi:dipeptidyl aminopeptidase/acylaminoacyl peptidase